MAATSALEEAYVCDAAAESLPLDDDAVVGYWAMELGKGCDEVMVALCVLHMKIGIY